MIWDEKILSDRHLNKYINSQFSDKIDAIFVKTTDVSDPSKCKHLSCEFVNEKQDERKTQPSLSTVFQIPPFIMSHMVT